MIAVEAQTVNSLPTPESILTPRRPRIVMAYGCNLAAFGDYNVRGRAGFGFSLGSPDEIAVGSGGETSFGIDASGNAIVTGNYTFVQGAANLWIDQLSIPGFLCRPDGFQWAKAFTYGSQLMTYLAIAGGVNLEAYIGSFTSPTAAEGATTRVITDPGFEPQAVIFLWAKVPSLATPHNTQWGGPAFGMGALGDDGVQWAFQTTNGYLAPSAASAVYHHSARCFAALGTPSLVCLGTGTTTATGFDVAFDRADVRASESGYGFPIDGRVIGYIALRDTAGGFKVGNGTQKTSPGSQSYSGCGFAPQAVLLGHANADASATIYGPRGAWHIGSFDDDTETSMLNGRLYGRGIDDVSIRFAPTSTAILASAVRQSLDADGFTLDWTTADAVARPFGWVAMATEGYDPDCPPGMPQIYRYLRGR